MIAMLGPIEMAACFYQFLYAITEERKYVPVLIGSLICFISGLILNVIFLVNFHK